MHPHRTFLFLALAGALVACKKKEAPPPEPPAENVPTHVASSDPAPVAEEHVAVTPAEGASADPAVTGLVAAEIAAADPTLAPETEAKPAAEKAVAEAEAEPAKPSEEKPAETKPASDKKKGDKDAKDKPAETAKEEKPKFKELGVQITKPGSGTAATAGKRVVLHYRASLVDAAKPFDSTYAIRRPIEVDLGGTAKLQVIEGLRRGLEGLMPGSEARLEIPASLAWAEKGAPGVGVPPNADVIFEVQVLDVQ